MVTKTEEKKLVLCIEKEREFLGVANQNLFANRFTLSARGYTKMQTGIDKLVDSEA